MNRVGRDEKTGEEADHENGGAGPRARGLVNDGEEGELAVYSCIDVLNRVEKGEGHRESRHEAHSDSGEEGERYSLLGLGRLVGNMHGSIEAWCPKSQR